MNQLNELIEHLYREGIEEGQLLQKQDVAGTLLVPADASTPDLDRIRVMLEQMTQHLGAKEKSLLTDTQTSTLDYGQVQQLLLYWEKLQSDIEALKAHIRSLESDIVMMQPWGDFDVLKVEQLRQHGCNIRFWLMKSGQLALQQSEEWYTRCNVLKVDQDTDWDYFVTVTTQDDTLPDLPPEAQEQAICPCPVSTLIMLQTRDKDSLKQLEAEQASFTQMHYASLLHTLRQQDPSSGLPQDKRNVKLRQRLRELFRRN